MNTQSDAELASVSEQAGFRLNRFEVYNWGNSSKEAILNDETMGKILKLDGVLTGTPFYRAQNLNINAFCIALLLCLIIIKLYKKI